MNASDIMTKTVITGQPDTTVAQAAELMMQNRISAIPVLDSRANLLQALAEQPVVHIPAKTDVDEKRDIVMRALAQVPSLNAVHLNVIVADKRVNVWGIVNSNDEEAAAKVALEAIDGLGEISVHLGRVPNYAWGI